MTCQARIICEGAAWTCCRPRGHGKGKPLTAVARMHQSIVTGFRGDDRAWEVRWFDPDLLTDGNGQPVDPATMELAK